MLQCYFLCIKYDLFDFLKMQEHFSMQETHNFKLALKNMPLNINSSTDFMFIVQSLPRDSSNDHLLN